MKFKNSNVIHAFLILTAAILVGAGCGQSEKKAAAADPFGTNKLETVFADAAAPVRNAIKKSETAIAAQDYGAAYDALQVLSRDKTLSPEQMDALKNSLLALGNVPRRAP